MHAYTSKIACMWGVRIVLYCVTSRLLWLLGDKVIRDPVKGTRYDTCAGAIKQASTRSYVGWVELKLDLSSPHEISVL